MNFCERSRNASRLERKSPAPEARGEGSAVRKKTQASVLIQSEPIKLPNLASCLAVRSLIGRATSIFETEPHERASDSLHEFGRFTAHARRAGSASAMILTCALAGPFVAMRPEGGITCGGRIHPENCRLIW